MSREEVARLDRSKPPPGHLVWLDDEWQCVCWGLEDDGQALNHPDDGLTEETAIAAAWAYHEKRSDPPGMWSFDGRFDGRFGLACDLDGLGTMLGRAGGRAAAWAWYWRRVAVANALGRIAVATWWSRCLAWSDEQVEEVEQWLRWQSARQKTAKPPAFPEVLRG